MKIVYIVHPISGDVPGNVKKILKIVKDINLSRSDVVPFVPYLADVLAMDDDVPEERAMGIENNVALLNSGVVNELWVYGKKISAGMEAEIDLAFELNIPVVVMDPELMWPIWLGFVAESGIGYQGVYCSNCGGRHGYSGKECYERTGRAT
jgi:hypothetical protein